jgi:hypothetical protein
MRRLLLIVLSFLCAWSGLEAGYAAGPAPQSLTFQVEVYPTDLYLPNQVINFPQPDLFPTAATLTVRVRTASQQPAADVPVYFRTGRDCARVAALTEDRAQTDDQGVAQVRLEVQQTTGLCRVQVQVGDVTREVRVTVLPAPETPRERHLVPFRKRVR